MSEVKVTLWIAGENIDEDHVSDTLMRRGDHAERLLGDLLDRRVVDLIDWTAEESEGE